MEYTSPEYKGASPVEGYILQGPVSDRGALAKEMGESKLEESVRAAKDIITSGKSHERMPLDYLPDSMQDTPISAFRWHALAATEYVRLLCIFLVSRFLMH